MTTMADDWTQLLKELTSLRHGRGLTLRSLSRCQAVLAALNNPPIQEAYDHLLRLLTQLGDDEPAQALRSAYAIGLADPRNLTERRTDRQRDTGRDPKTLAGYENKMIEELVSRILGSIKPTVSDSEVYVVGHLAGNRLERIEVSVRFPADKDGNVFERSVDYENKAQVQSLPALLYQLPHDWSPQNLILAVSVPEGTQCTFFGTAASELLGLMFGANAQELPVQDDMVIIQIERPVKGVIYGVYWVLTD